LILSHPSQLRIPPSLSSVCSSLLSFANSHFVRNRIGHLFSCCVCDCVLTAVRLHQQPRYLFCWISCQINQSWICLLLATSVFSVLTSVVIESVVGLSCGLTPLQCTHLILLSWQSCSCLIHPSPIIAKLLLLDYLAIPDYL
jgi:hypothetical protein